MDPFFLFFFTISDQRRLIRSKLKFSNILRSEPFLWNIVRKFIFFGKLRFEWCKIHFYCEIFNLQTFLNLQKKFYKISKISKKKYKFSKQCLKFYKIFKFFKNL